MKNNFLLDKKFSEQYEEYFAYKLGLKLNKVNCDDKGIDLFDDNNNYDVKAYRAPKIVKEFTGIFIETFLPLSGHKGWFNDDDKLTTHYIILKDCSEYMILFDKMWIISKDYLKTAIQEAENDGRLQVKKIDTAWGIILPYEYLDRYCEHMEIGQRRVKNVQ